MSSRPALPVASVPSPSAARSAQPTATGAVPAARVGLFLLLATGVTSALSLSVATGLLPETAVGLVVPLAQLSPLLAALLVRRRDEPWWRALALTIPSGRALVWAALAAVVAFALVPATRILLGLGLGADPSVGGPPLLGLLLAVPAVLAMQAVLAIGEETGWRGWLQSALAPYGFWRMSLLIGMMWALWHLPIVLALGLSGREMISYLGTIVAVAPLLSALRRLSGTVWAAILGHGLLNSLRVALEQNVLGPVDPMLLWVLDLSSWALWIGVAWMVLRSGEGLVPTGGSAASESERRRGGRRGAGLRGARSAAPRGSAPRPGPPRR